MQETEFLEIINFVLNELNIFDLHYQQQPTITRFILHALSQKLKIIANAFLNNCLIIFDDQANALSIEHSLTNYRYHVLLGFIIDAFDRSENTFAEEVDHDFIKLLLSIIVKINIKRCFDTESQIRQRKNAQRAYQQFISTNLVMNDLFIMSNLQFKTLEYSNYLQQRVQLLKITKNKNHFFHYPARHLIKAMDCQIAKHEKYGFPLPCAIYTRYLKQANTIVHPHASTTQKLQAAEMLQKEVNFVAGAASKTKAVAGSLAIFTSFATAFLCFQMGFAFPPLIFAGIVLLTVGIYLMADARQHGLSKGLSAFSIFADKKLRFSRIKKDEHNNALMKATT